MNDNPKRNKDEVQLIAGFLATALEMEDDMSGDVYGDFLLNEGWPANFNGEAFKNVKHLLEVLIQDTEAHKKMFLVLINKLDSNGQ